MLHLEVDSPRLGGQDRGKKRAGPNVQPTDDGVADQDSAVGEASGAWISTGSPLRTRSKETEVTQVAGQTSTTGRSRIRGYKWLEQGRIDPEGEFVWEERRSAPGPWMRIEGPVSTAIAACHAGGLPYEICDELWEVELDAPFGHQPFLEQLPYNRFPLFGDQERRVLASRGRLVRRVRSWTPEVAGEFWRWCAGEGRKRLLQALRDADDGLRLVPTPPEPPDGSNRTFNGGVDFHPVYASREGPSPEIIGLERAQDLIGIWTTARSAAVAGDSSVTARAFARAAARMRAAAASTYAMLLRPEEPSNRLESVAGRAYASERRRQARWLSDRLGLGDTETPGRNVPALASRS